MEATCKGRENDMDGKIYELPPMKRGSTQEQVDELREYLLRLVQQLNEEEKK